MPPKQPGLDYSKIQMRPKVMAPAAPRMEMANKPEMTEGLRKFMVSTVMGASMLMNTASATAEY